ncbi:MAG: type II toxin-antitoxin system VapC family toxin [Betaproteobacteria bacterium]|nr:MAG: type II toxin-antitoxin system VapC family toxin [Betaproteobacteria bacterium]
MRLLLDTQIFLWFLADSSRLSRKARAEIGRANEVFISAASIWEAAIKTGIGKLSVSLDQLVAGIGASGFAELPVSALHASRVAALPLHHRDPFDRLLVAQAILEPLHLMTADAAMKPYSELVMLV